MSVAVSGEAKIKRIGNGLFLPVPTKEAKAEGFQEGSTVRFLIMDPGGLNPAAFGSLRRRLKGLDLQRMKDELREASP